MKTSLYLKLCMMGLCGSCMQGEQQTGNAVEKTYSLTEMLEGKWICETGEGLITEIWQKNSDDLSFGISQSEEAGDTLLKENIRLEKKQNKWHYCPLVYGQNDNKPVCFVSDSISETYVRFVNLRHDFPTHIEYRFSGRDSCYITVSGSGRRFSLRMKKTSLHDYEGN